MYSFSDRYLKNRKSDMLLEAVMSGKGIIFEGEDVPPIPEDNSDSQDGEKEQQNNEPSAEKPQQAPEQPQQPVQEQPKETKPSAENVNAEHDTTGSKKVDAATLAEQFAQSGWLKKILIYALNKLTQGKGGAQTESIRRYGSNLMEGNAGSSQYINAATKRPITTGDLKPFVSAALTKFAHDNRLLATPAVINAATLITVHNTGKNTIRQKMAEQKMKTKEMQKSEDTQSAQQQDSPSIDSGDVGSQPSEAPAPDDSQPQETPQPNDQNTEDTPNTTADDASDQKDQAPESENKNEN